MSSPVECPKCGTLNDASAAQCSKCDINLQWALKNWDKYVSGSQNANAPLILISDYNEDVPELFQVVLKIAGYRTAIAANGDALLTLDLAERLKPDLLITDYLRPGSVQGDEMIRRLKANPITSDIPVLLVTALVEDDTRRYIRRSFEAGAVGYLNKGEMSMEDLTTLVSHTLPYNPAIWIVHLSLRKEVRDAIRSKGLRLMIGGWRDPADDPVRSARALKPDVIAVGMDAIRTVIPPLKADRYLRHIPIIAVAEEPDPEFERKAFDAGADSVYMGSLSAESLLTAIRPMLQKIGRA